jgi:hypothetical protein
MSKLRHRVMLAVVVARHHPVRRPNYAAIEMQGHAQRTVLTRRRSPPAKVFGDFFE